MVRAIVSSVSFIREYIRNSVESGDINQFDADFLNEIIDICESLYKSYNEGKIDQQGLEQNARDHAKEIIFQYTKESTSKVRDYLQDILENFDQDLLDVDIDLGTDVSTMTIKEAETMEGNRPFDQALELMDKFDYALMDYDEGAMSKETITQKFDTLKTKVEMLKKECGIEDRTFLNEKMKQFKEVMEYYNIPVEEYNESTETQSNLKTWLDSKGLRGEWDEAMRTMDYQAITDLLVMFNNQELNFFESKKIREAEAHQFLVKDIALEGDELHLSCYDRKHDEDFDKYIMAYKKSIHLLEKDPAFDLTDDVAAKCKELLPTLEESKKLTESSQSPMIFKVGNVYRLTPNDSYAYDRVEILGITWNDMVGQCTIQYKVVMKDGSVEEGQSEARDLISTIKKNNQDRVEFYKTEVPQMNESETLTEATTPYMSKLARYINNTVQDCINHGEGAFKSAEMGLEIYAEWADNEEDIRVTVRSEGQTIRHTELGVASVVYDIDPLA